MLSINMDDVMQVVSNIQNYLIAFGVVLVLALLVMFAVRKMPKAKKKMIRAQSGLAILLALAAALLFLYNLFYLSLQLYFSSPAPVHYSQRTSNTAFFSKLTHSLDSPAARGRLCLLLLWISCVFCLDSWILSGIINSAMEICLTLTAGVLFWLFFPSFRPAPNHPHSLL